MLGLRKPNFNTKIIPFEKSPNAENCKRGPLRFFNIHSVAKCQKIEGGLFGVFKQFSKKMKNFNDSLIVPKILKKGTLWDFSTIVLLQNIKKKEKRMFWGHLKNFEKKVSKPKSLIVPKKVRTFCFRILVKNLAHTHGFEHESTGLESKHLTTRPKKSELCDLRSETSCRAEKNLHFPITLAYRKCNYQQSIKVFRKQDV